MRSVFAGCRIEAELGRGGMGIVYRATQLRLERLVALKVIAPNLARDQRFRERFGRESRLAASIDHPHVVPIYEGGEERGHLYLIMRYVPGPDLGRLLERERLLRPSRAAGIIDQVASALDAAHERGLVHRDVKPANVLLTTSKGEHAYLSDFGLTKRVASESGLTATGVFVGTADYVAPEQVLGRRVDARADVYSLAALLFHALTGEVPYQREDDMAKLFAHAHADPPRPSELVPDLGSAFDTLIERGMAKDPGDRYPSAGDFGRAVTAAAYGGRMTAPERTVATGRAAPAPRSGGASASPPKDGAPARAHTGVRRTVHRPLRLSLPLVLAALALLAFAAAAGVWAGSRGRTASSGSASVAPGGGGRSSPVTDGATGRRTMPVTRQGSAQRQAGTTSRPAREPLSSSSPLTTEGLGPVLVGMSRDKAEQEAGTPLIDQGPVTQGCSYLRPAHLDGVNFMVVGDEIARVEVSRPSVATQSGIRVGDDEDAVYRAYGSQIDRQENPYDQKGSFLKFVPRDSSDPNRMVFVTDGSKVNEIYAGREPEVEYAEGCA